MKPKRNLCAALMLLCTCAGCESYSVHSFRSDDAVIMYCGYWSTPRYRIALEDMVVSQTHTTATYEFTNPPDNVVLSVGLNFCNDADLAALIELGAHASVQIAHADGQIVLVFEGPLRDGFSSPTNGTWCPHGIAMIPPARGRFRDLGQVLERSMISHDSQPSVDQWSYGPGNGILVAWGAWPELAHGSYIIEFSIETSAPPARPVRILPMLTGGSRGVL